MSKLPCEFVDSLTGINGFDQDAFINVHENVESITSIRLNPHKVVALNNDPSLIFSFPLGPNVPWASNAYYINERPSFTFDPLFHAGLYYVQEASSMFLEQAIKQTVDVTKPLRVLDLCAAPGGKSTHIQSLLSNGSLLVSNEIIRSRAAVLVQNIIKWGASNVIVTNNEPTAFQKLPNFFDVIIIDAPCSGSGLFRKEEQSINEWSVNNVILCQQRQQKILEDILPALKEEGTLIYSTCSYSKEEDEEIIDWLTSESSMENISLTIKDEWGIVTTESKVNRATGYRFFPDKVKGEGFFLSVFRKTNKVTMKDRFKRFIPEKATNKEMAIINEWVDITDACIIRNNDRLIAIPDFILEDLYRIKSVLNIQYAGVWLGQVMKEKLIPEHALALNMILSPRIPSTALGYDESIKYLQRQEINVNTVSPGWQTVNYQNCRLGWINSLINRINNYYPKELRILKQHNDASFNK